MANKRHKPEEIVTKLRQVEVLVGQGMARIDAIRQVRIVDNATNSNSADPPCARPLPRKTVSLPSTNRPENDNKGSSNGIDCQRRIKNTALAGVTMHHRGGVYGGAKLVQAG